MGMVMDKWRLQGVVERELDVEEEQSVVVGRAGGSDDHGPH